MDYCNENILEKFQKLQNILQYIKNLKVLEFKLRMNIKWIFGNV